MSESVGTVHLSISADLDTLEARLKQRFAVLGKQLGDQLGQDIGRQATRGVETSMAGVAKTAFVPLEQSAKQAGQKISDNLKVDVKTDKAKAQLDALAAQRRIVELQVEANTRKAEAKVAEFDARENQLRIDVDAGTEGAKAKLDALLAERKTFEIEVEVQTLRARQQLDSIDQRRKVVYEADAKTEGAKSKLDALGGSINGIGSGFSTLGLLGVASMGTLIPVAVAATGAVLALGVAAAGVGAAFGVAKLAFSGVGAALTALNAQQSKAGENAAKATAASISMANAQDALKQAVQGVTDAQRQAATASEQASRRTADAAQAVQDAISTAASRTAAAEQTLQAAQQDALQTQKDLNAAREQAVRDLEDIANRASDAALNQRAAAMDLTDAEANYQKVLADPKSTQAQKDRAQLTRDQAAQRKKEADEEAKRAADDAEKAKKAGIEGSAAVVSAKQREKAANDKVHQSEVDLTNTRIDGARNVAKAQRDLADARKNEADVARQNAESIAKAEQGVVQAQRGIQSALMATQQVGATTRNAVNEAFQDLSPAAKHFTLFIFGLKDDLDSLRASAAESLLPPLEKAIKLLLPYLPQVKSFVSEVGKATGDVAIKIAKSLTGPEWKAFFTAVKKEAPGAISAIGDIFVTLGKTIAKVFTAAAPYAQPILTGIKKFFDRIDEKATPGKLKKLFDGIVPTLAAVWNVVEAIGSVLQSIVTSGNGKQTNAADTLNKVADAISRLGKFIDAHPDVVNKLMGIAAGMVAIKAASPAISTIGSLGQAIGGLASVMNLFKEGGTLAGLFAAGGFFGAGGAVVTAVEAVAAAVGLAVAPFLLVVAAILGVVAGLYLLYTKCTWFHDAVNTVVHKIGDFFHWLWDKAVQPVLAAIGKVFEWLYNNVVKPVWDAIYLAIQIAWGLIEVIFGTIEIAVKLIGLAWQYAYNHWIKPLWDDLAGFISDKWNGHIKPILNVIGSYMKTTVAPKLKSALGVIKNVWDSLMDIFKAPIKFLVQTVLDNGLFAAYNWVAKKFGVKPDNVYIPLPSWLGGTTASTSGAGHGGGGVTQQRAFATGGSVFGPGTGTSDSIPALLSNGEHVWTAKEVQAAGGHGAVEAIRQGILESGAPGFASGGGVWNWVKDKVTSAGSWAWNSAKNLASLATDFLSNPLGILKKIATSALNRLPGGTGGLLGRVIVGMTNKIVGGMASFAKGLLGFGGGSGGGGGGSSAPVGHLIPGGNIANQQIGQTLAAARGWTGSQWLALKSLWNGESGWNQFANNPSSGAYGIPQSLPGNKMASAGADWRTNPATQIKWGLNYIAQVYGNPGNTYAKWLSRSPHWYDDGGWLNPGSTLVRNDTGKPEAVFTAAQWRTLEDNLLGGGAGGGDYSKTTNIDVTAYGDPHYIANAISNAQDRHDLLERITR